MLRVVRTVAFLIAGLSTPNQDVRWITDQDDIAPSEEGFADMSNVFQATVNSYLSHPIGGLSCSTTAGSPLEVEDFVAIPDLTAGALVELFAAYAKRGVSMSEHLVLPRPDDLPGKTHDILNWLAADLSLRRLVYAVDPGPQDGTIEITDVNVAGSSLIVR